jgi:putative nucleotidyltransferase with HDIG domain
VGAISVTDLEPKVEDRSELVGALGRLIDLRDGYLGVDTQEVVRLATAIGGRLGIPVADEDDLTVAAQVHDIGKIGVPDGILQKPGRLDDEERAIVQRHVIWGAETLERIPGFDRVADIVRSHHERWDGSGYPSGLVGDASPTESRIIGVCEAYRAMTSDRPYRAALAPAQALGLIAAARGAAFDPGVVDALIDVLGPDGVVPSTPEGTNGNGTKLSEDPDLPEPDPAAGPMARPKAGSRLQSALHRLDGLPALTESRHRLIELLSGSQPSIGRMVAVIESDVALTVAVLRLANRSQRRTGKSVGGVPKAVEILTPQGVELLVSRMMVTDFFEVGSGWTVPPNRFRRHAISVREACLRVAREIDFQERDELVVAALLHDIGKLVLADMHVGYPDRHFSENDPPDQRLATERHEFGLDHAAVGGMVARRWGLPDKLVEAIEKHHMRDGSTMSAVLRLGDLLAHFSHGGHLPGHLIGEAGERLDIGEDPMRALLYDVTATAQSEERVIQDPSPLSRQETASLRCLAAGQTYKQAALELGLSVSTVRSHLHRAYVKLEVVDRAQAVLTAKDRGWI